MMMIFRSLWAREILSHLPCATLGRGSQESPPLAHPKGDQSWIFTGRTDAEAKASILWPPDAKSQLIGKDPDVGKDWRREEKGMTEDKMVGWHHWLDGHEFEQAPGAGDGHGSLASFRPRGPKESDTTEQLNWTELTNVSPGVLVTRVSILVTTVYWIARSFPNKWKFWNIHDLKGPPFYTETKEIFDSPWIVSGTFLTC